MLESPGVTYASDGTGQEYYGKATLRDPAGTVLLEVDNTRLNSSGSQIALTTRFQTMDADDLSVSYVEQSVEGGHLTADFVSVMTAQTFSPDDRLLKTLNMGQGFRTDTDTGTGSIGTETDPEPVTETETSGASAAGGCRSADRQCLCGAGADRYSARCPLLQKGKLNYGTEEQALSPVRLCG